MSGKVILSVKERFLAKVEKTDTCWTWTAGLTGKGYGRLWVGQRNEFAHRVSWELFRGKRPKDMIVCHHCDNPGCVNPDHLFLGTHADNIRDRDEKLRTARGEKNGNRKLDEEQARFIKYSVMSPDTLAARFDIDRTQVFNIRAGKQWKHVK